MLPASGGAMCKFDTRNSRRGGHSCPLGKRVNPPPAVQRTFEIRVKKSLIRRLVRFAILWLRLPFMNARLVFFAFSLVFPLLLAAQNPARAAEFSRTEDVIYGRKFGMALTMDVFMPAEPNGAGIVFVVSGGWFSGKQAIHPEHPLLISLLGRGYTVFAVLHGSQPKFQIPEIIEDMHRAVRFIRYHASEYSIDPKRLGVTGGSAGGHLSLILATLGGPGDPEASDPVDRGSSAVQAVACFFPPTDFLNYGAPGVDGTGVGVLAPFKQAFGPRADEPGSRRELALEISPIYHVTAELPPVLIVHGDADRLVPIQQAQTFIERASEAGAAAKLITRKGRDHGWGDVQPDVEAFADWFDEHLQPSED